MADVTKIYKDKENFANRLIDQDPEYYRDLDALYFALIGFSFDSDNFEIRTGEGKLIAHLREVVNLPSVFHLAGALADPRHFTAIERYVNAVTYELAFPMIEDDTQSTLHAAYECLVLLKIISTTGGQVPVAARKSWSVLAAIKNQSCECYLLDDYPKALIFKKLEPIGDGVLLKIGQCIDTFSMLRAEPGFALAVDSYYSFGQAQSPRLMAATLWSGIEALFNVKSELRFRLSLYMASILHQDSSKRFDEFKKIQKLYDVRSKIVHGQKMDEKEILHHTWEASILLSQLIMAVVANGKMFSSEDIEKNILEKHNP